MSDKKYVIPQEIIDLFGEADDAEKCREDAVGFVWSYKRALKYAEIARTKREEAWKMIYDLYPDAMTKKCQVIYKKRELEFLE